MAILHELPEPAFSEWIASRPQAIQAVIRSYPPNKLYRMGNHRVTIYSYNEDGTVTVNVTGEFNRILFGRRVFGVNPSELVECDLPAPGEDLGDTAKEAGYDEDDIRNIIIPKIKAFNEGRSDG